MAVKDFFPFWKQLTPQQQDKLQQAATLHHAAKNTILHNGSEDCIGLLLVKQGQLRAYILSEEGRELTLYRLLDWDICLFSAACMMQSLQFEITVQATQDTDFYIIPAEIYRQLMQESIAVANFTNELMATRFSDVIWLIDQVVNKRMDARVAGFLLEESRLNHTVQLKMTHDIIARNLGSAREVVSRILKYLQEEGMITLSRGGIFITNQQKLLEIAKGSIR